MPRDYAEWDQIVRDLDSSSDEDERTKIRKLKQAQGSPPDQVHPLFAVSSDVASKHRPVLLSLLESPYCEVARWILENFGVSYQDFQFPFGIHYWASLPYKRPSETANDDHPLDIPILEIQAFGEIQHGCLGIAGYLSSIAPENLRGLLTFTPPAVKFYHELSQDLAPATMGLYYTLLLNDYNFIRSLIFDKIHLQSWRSITMVLWPALYAILMVKYKAHDHRATVRYWKTVEGWFDRVEKTRGKKKHLFGDKPSVADWLFAVLAMQVMFPSDDSVHDLPLPAVESLTRQKEFKSKSFELRDHPAGLYATTLARRFRSSKKRHSSAGPYRYQPSKHAKMANPWWSEFWVLATLVYGALSLVLVSGWVVIFYFPWYYTVAGYVVIIPLLLFTVVRPLKNNLVGSRTKAFMKAKQDAEAHFKREQKR